MGNRFIGLSNKAIRENPCSSVAAFLRGPASKRQQCNIACLLDRQRQPSLMRRANAGQTARHNSPAFRHELRQQTNILVVDSFNLLDAELANLLTSEILASASAATFAAPARSARTRRWTSFPAIRPVTAGR